jgi:hypothetical protein
LLLTVPAGCSTAEKLPPGQVVFECPDALVSVGVDVSDVTTLWREDTRPLVSLRVGPAGIERTRDGAMTLVFGADDRVPLVERDDSMFYSPPDQLDGRTETGVTTALHMSFFAAEPLALLLETLAATLRTSHGSARDGARALSRHLLSAERVEVHGSAGPNGTLAGWISLTPAGRRKLIDAWDAATAAETTNVPGSLPTGASGAEGSPG